MDPSTNISTAPAPTPAPPPAASPPSKDPTGLIVVLKIVVVILLVGVILLGLFRAGAEGYAWWELRQADAALARQNYAEAKPYLVAALKVRPKSAELYLRLGRLCRQMSQLDEAYDYLKTCKKLGGETEAYQLEMLMFQAQVGQVEEVYERLWVYVEKDRPEAPLVLESLVLACMPQELTEIALSHAERWAQKQPDNVQALYYKAMCVAQVGPAQEAVTILDKAQARDPSREDIQQMRGFLLADLHQYDKAQEVLDPYLKKHPKDSMSLLAKVRCLYGKGELQAAQDLLAESLKDDGGTPDLWAERGKIAMQMNDPYHAEQWLRRAVHDDPCHQIANFNLISCLRNLAGRELEKGNSKKAEELRQEASKIENDDRRRTKDAKRAQVILTQEVPKLSNPDVSGELGLILLRNCRDHSGAMWLYKALAKDPNNVTYHEALSNYWAKYNRAERGQTHNEFLAKYWEEHKDKDKAKFYRDRLPKP